MLSWHFFYACSHEIRGLEHPAVFTLVFFFSVGTARAVVPPEEETLIIMRRYGSSQCWYHVQQEYYVEKSNIIAKIKAHPQVKKLCCAPVTLPLLFAEGPWLDMFWGNLITHRQYIQENPEPSYQSQYGDYRYDLVVIFAC